MVAMQMKSGRENGGGRDRPRQTDLSGKDAGSFTKEHQGTLHFFTIYQCKNSSFIKER